MVRMPSSLQYASDTELATLAQQARAPEILTAVNAEMNRRKGGASLAQVAQSNSPYLTAPQSEGPVPDDGPSLDRVAEGSWTPPWQKMGGPSLPPGVSGKPAEAEMSAEELPGYPADNSVPPDMKRGARSHDDNIMGIDRSLLETGKMMADAEDNPDMIEQLIAQLSGGGMSDDQIRSNAIAKAGFAMAGSRNPYFFGALGEGGTAGMEDYEKSKQEQLMNRVRAAGLEQEERGYRDTKEMRDQFNAEVKNLSADDQRLIRLIGPDNYAQIVAAGLKPQNVPASLQEYAASQSQGYKGSYTDWRKEIKAAGRSSTSVNVNMPKSIGKGDEKLMEIGAEGFSQAQEVLPLFGIAREAAKNFGQSGPLGGVGLFVERGKNYLGLPNNAGAGEVLQGMQTRLGTLMRIPGSGATSNMEMSLYMQSVPSLMNSQNGNIALANIGEKLVQRRMANYQRMQNYINEHGNSVGYTPDDTPVLNEDDMAILKNPPQPETTIPTGTSGSVPSGAVVDELPPGFE